MIRNIMKVCLLMTAITTVHAADFSPFGITIGEKSSLYPTNYTPKVLEPVQVNPPKPIEKIFQTYQVYFNDEKQVRKIEAIGLPQIDEAACQSIAGLLDVQFRENYKNATEGVQKGAAFAYIIPDKSERYMAYFQCQDNAVHYVMYNPGLEQIQDNTADPKKELQ